MVLLSGSRPDFVMFIEAEKKALCIYFIVYMLSHHNQRAAPT